MANASTDLFNIKGSPEPVGSALSWAGQPINEFNTALWWITTVHGEVRANRGWGAYTFSGFRGSVGGNRSLTVAALIGMSRVCRVLQSRDREGAVGFANTFKHLRGWDIPIWLHGCLYTNSSWSSAI